MTFAIMSHSVLFVKNCNQNYDCHFKFQRSYWPRGKVLGGTSSINFLMYLRGSSHDYNEWADKGCKGWSYDEVLPYFKKAENNRNKRYAKTGMCML